VRLLAVGILLLFLLGLFVLEDLVDNDATDDKLEAAEDDHVDEVLPELFVAYRRSGKQTESL
jgi:hypothetical protein